MTTILLVKTNDGIFVASDSQVTNGSHLRLPDSVCKIQSVDGKILIAGCGSVGLLQRLLDSSLKDIKCRRILNDSDLDLRTEEVAKILSEKNFYLPLQYRRFQSAGFLLGGLCSDNEIKGYSVGDDGSLLEVETFLTDGSGSELALSILKTHYKKELTPEQASSLCFVALKSASGSDIYSHSPFFVMSILWEKKKLSFKKWTEVEEKK